MTIATQPGEIARVVMFSVFIDMVHNDDRLFLETAKYAFLFLSRSHKHLAVRVLTILEVAVALTSIGAAVPRETACARTEKMLGPRERFALFVYFLPTLMTFDVLSFSSPNPGTWWRAIHTAPAPYCRGLRIK